MRILIHGMQSSGASLFCFFLAQHSERVGIIDLHSLVEAPALSDVTKDVVMKCVVSSRIPLQKQIANFLPDIRILFRRNRLVNLSSLHHKGYRNESGTMESKFALMDGLNDKDYDLVLDYEEFLFDQSSCLSKLGVIAEPWFYDFPRTREQIRAFNEEHSEWCRQRKGYGFGNIRFGSNGKVTLPKLIGQQDKIRGYLQSRPRLLSDFVEFSRWYQQNVDFDLVPMFSWLSWEENRERNGSCQLSQREVRCEDHSDAEERSS